MKKILIVGAGFAGAVLAREIVTKTKCRVTVIDQRAHVAGNCHTYVDKNNIMIHAYGPHIFHTSNKKIWNYINSFGEFSTFVNRVKISNKKGIFSMPINLHTINQYFNKKLDPESAKNFVKKKSQNLKNIKQ